MVHIARFIPPSVASGVLRMFDEVRPCFVLCAAIEIPNDAWCQAQLGLKHGGLDLCSLSQHTAAAVIPQALAVRTTSTFSTQ